VQSFAINLLEKFPNWLVGVPKLKSYFASKLTGEIYRFCSLSENYKIEINLNDSSENYLWFGCKPKEIINFLRSNLRPDSIFVDCGANIGIWTLIALEFIKKEGVVHSFEPNPNLCQRLQKNLDYNNMGEQCSIHAVALSSNSKTEFLYLDDFNHQMGSLHKGNNENNKIKVLTKTFDSFNMDRVNGMKIDVEGHETQVIKGATKTISSLKPWLVVELNNSFHEIQKITQWEVYNMLTDIGYTTNFNNTETLEYTFCRDIVFYNSAKSHFDQYPPFL
jgi:FkbM family methyltransferase